MPVFGSIPVAGERYEHDVFIRLNKKVEKRKKKLSKQVFGAWHLISLGEAEHIYEEGAVRLIIGTGQSGMVTLSLEAEEFFRQKGSAVELAGNSSPLPVNGRFNHFIHPTIQALIF